MPLFRPLPAAVALAAALPCLVLAADPPADADKFAASVERRVNDWWLKPDEQRFDSIGWAADLLTARKLAREHNRPVFLFTMDGRVNLGRC